MSYGISDSIYYCKCNYITLILLNCLQIAMHEYFTSIHKFHLFLSIFFAVCQLFFCFLSLPTANCLFMSQSITYRQQSSSQIDIEQTFFMFLFYFHAYAFIHCDCLCFCHAVAGFDEESWLIL